MAKSKSIFDFHGTIGGITFVNSIAYGPHLRSKRGTNKKAKLNDSLKAASKLTIMANSPAQLLRNALLPYMEGFKAGRLWNLLVSIFRNQLKESGAINFGKLQPFEIDKKYPFDRFLPLQPEISPDKKAGKITVKLSYDSHPEFHRSQSVDGYRLGAIAIFPDPSKSTAKTSDAFTPIISFKEEVSGWSLDLAIPARSKSFVVCLTIDGCIGGLVNNTPATKGMKVVWSGLV